MCLKSCCAIDSTYPESARNTSRPSRSFAIYWYLRFLELVEFLGIVALNPASLVQVYGFPAALCVVLVLQAVLYNLKLQLPHCAYNLSTVELVDKKLSHTLVHELVDALLKLLRLHRVVVLDVFEHLG